MTPPRRFAVRISTPDYGRGAEPSGRHGKRHTSSRPPPRSRPWRAARVPTSGDELANVPGDILRTLTDPVIDWLLDTDPSIRWQVMRDLTDTPAAVVAAERSRVASEGWGSQLLDQQRPDGQWGDGIATPYWWSNMYTLVFLRDLGIDPASARARGDRRRRAIARRVGRLGRPPA